MWEAGGERRGRGGRERVGVRERERARARESVVYNDMLYITRTLYVCKCTITNTLYTLACLHVPLTPDFVAFQASAA